MTIISKTISCKNVCEITHLSGGRKWGIMSIVPHGKQSEGVDQFSLVGWLWQLSPKSENSLWRWQCPTAHFEKCKINLWQIVSSFYCRFFLSCSLLQALLLAQCEKCVACFQVKQNQIGQEIICFSNGVHVLGRKLDLGSSSISYSHRHAV